MDTELTLPPESAMEIVDSEVVEDNFPASCIHITNYKSEFVLDDYRHLYSFYVSCISKERKNNDCVCREQSCETNRTRIHACLYCIYFGCFNSKFSHIYHHARSNNHPLGMDTDSGHVFCFECNDYKHDFDFEKIREEQNLITSQQIGITTCATYKWEPNLDEINLLTWHEIVHDSKSDIRGFVNINTTICLMITLIQTLLHAPVFRDYLLSFKHKCKVEEKTDYPTCFICELAKILQECFSGNSKPYYITDFLILIKDRLERFAVTEHQDAHEFFDPFLSKLCEDCEESKNASCDCFIHTTFELSWHTEYTCYKCRELTKSSEFSRWCILHGIIHVSTILSEEGISLTDYLKSFLLESARCDSCSEKNVESMKFVLEKLPMVLTIAFYFSGKSEKKPRKNKKRRKYINYKEFLNICPENVKDGSKWEVFENPEYQYYLFSVIEHIGQEQGGHFIVYIRKDINKWFSCNCDTIEPRTLEEILNLEDAFMFFYHKQFP